jgi:hypothetical protein
VEIDFTFLSSEQSESPYSGCTTPYLLKVIAFALVEEGPGSHHYIGTKAAQSWTLYRTAQILKRLLVGSLGVCNILPKTATIPISRCV